MKSSRLCARLLGVALILSVAGCERVSRIDAESPPPQRGDEVFPAGEASTFASKELYQAAAPAAPSEVGAAFPGSLMSTLAASQPERYLIKNASLLIEVEEARKAAEHLAALVQAAGGYVSDMRESVDGLGIRHVTMQVRVPAERLAEAVQQIETAGKVLEKQITSEDVTEEYVDTEAKLRNLRKTEERLLDHLSRTGMLNDIILVEREINRVREEIERLDGRMRFLSHRVAFSTIAVTLTEAARPQPLLPPESFSTGGVATEAARALVSFAQVQWSRLIWMGVWTPVWLLPILVVLGLVRRLRRHRKASRQKGQATDR